MSIHAAHRVRLSSQDVTGACVYTRQVVRHVPGILEGGVPTQGLEPWPCCHVTMCCRYTSGPPGFDGWYVIRQFATVGVRPPGTPGLSPRPIVHETGSAHRGIRTLTKPGLSRSPLPVGVGGLVRGNAHANTATSAPWCSVPRLTYRTTVETRGRIRWWCRSSGTHPRWNPITLNGTVI